MFPAHGYHEHVVQVYGYCSLKAREGIVMELCPLDLSTLLWQRTRGVTLAAGEVRAGLWLCRLLQFGAWRPAV